METRSDHGRVLTANLAVFGFTLFTSLVPVDRVLAANTTLKIFWSEPISAQAGSSIGSVIQDVSQDTDGSLAALIVDRRHQSVLVDMNEEGKGTHVDLTTKAHVLGIAHGAENALWLGGYIDKRMYVPGWTVTNAYLGKLDQHGQIVEERKFRSLRYRLIGSLFALPSGGIVVHGIDGDESWMANVSESGKVLWQQRFGFETKTAVTTIANGIVAVSFNATRPKKKKKKASWKDVVIWNFDLAGTVLSQKKIEVGINDSGGARFGMLIADKANDAIYVLSNTKELFNAKPIAVTKLSVDGRLIWRKQLPHSILQDKTKSAKSWITCYDGQTVLAGGDLLVTCSIKEEIFVSRLSAANGDVIVTSVPLPECHQGREAKLFPIQRPDGSVWLFGTPQGDNATGCTWLGELTLGGG